ncbi:hypothetical protein CROQUDRAFT_90510 [Cronartium quercuum f. sp. fusiforme G11]|uniref:Uncharacterized protein n=1 Tax=Cronartium quercuum f. sp. fusiforme G11 TaxID=708437 RepID=A0A9P6TEW6_9BASI|nr:hypothetical protein CROQUDRAFT_90510 [Cronartium quercuum f. sp. fusiforme G11]
MAISLGAHWATSEESVMNQEKLFPKFKQFNTLSTMEQAIILILGSPFTSYNVLFTAPGSIFNSFKRSSKFDHI